MADFGFSAKFLKAHPDVKKAVDAAVAGSWEMDKFLDSLKTTTWWKTTSDAQRRYDIMLYDNPRELSTLQLHARDMISRMVIQMGMTVPLSQQTAWAVQYVRNGMTEAELRYLVGSYYHHGGNTGLIGRARSDLTKLAADFGLKTSTNQVNNQIETILQAVRTVEDYATYYRDIAKQTYTAVADQLDAGFTIRQIMDPYLALAAQELGQNPTTMDVSDAMWNRALTYRGEKPVSATPQRTMDMSEWTRTVRTDPIYGFDRAEPAQRAASTLTQGLAQLFGAMG